MDFDRAYANGPSSPCAETFPPRWTREAAAFRAVMGQRAQIAIPYGPKPRNRLDLFLPEAAPQGLLVFVHGGYWLRFDREMWSHLAGSAVARGWACAVPSYTLAPEARIGAMTREIASAVEVAANLVSGPGRHRPLRRRSLERRDGLRRCVRVNPRQAGRAYLAACRSGANLSDGDERRPAARSGRNSRREPRPDSLRAEVQSHVWVGAQERPAFLWQARLLSEAWSCPWTPESGSITLTSSTG